MLLFGFWEIKFRNLPFSWFFYLCNMSNCKEYQYMQSNKILSIHKRVTLLFAEMMTMSFLYSTDIHSVAKDRSSIRSINWVYRNTGERCLAVTKLMLSSMAEAIATTCVLPRVWFKRHTDTLQQWSTTGNEHNAPSRTLGRNTYRNMTRAANKVAWLHN